MGKVHKGDDIKNFRKIYTYIIFGIILDYINRSDNEFGAFAILKLIIVLSFIKSTSKCCIKMTLTPRFKTV